MHCPSLRCEHFLVERHDDDEMMMMRLLRMQAWSGPVLYPLSQEKGKDSPPFLPLLMLLLILWKWQAP